MNLLSIGLYGNFLTENIAIKGRGMNEHPPWVFQDLGHMALDMVFVPRDCIPFNLKPYPKPPVDRKQGFVA